MLSQSLQLHVILFPSLEIPYWCEGSLRAGLPGWCMGFWETQISKGFQSVELELFFIAILWQYYGYYQNLLLSYQRWHWVFWWVIWWVFWWVFCPPLESPMCKFYTAWYLLSSYEWDRSRSRPSTRRNFNSGLCVFVTLGSCTQVGFKSNYWPLLLFLSIAYFQWWWTNTESASSCLHLACASHILMIS